MICRRSSPSVDRRMFCKFSAAAAGVLAIPGISLPGQLITGPLGNEVPADQVDQSTVKAMLMSAIDEARRLGAEYAEARVTRTVSQKFDRKKALTGDNERLSIGVRALVKGAWGFASSTYVSMNEGIAVTRHAVEQAQINAAVFMDKVSFGSYPVITGHWSTPIRIDPFTISMEEKMDYMRSVEGYLPLKFRTRSQGREADATGWYMNFTRQERFVANTENSFFSQTLYRSNGRYGLRWNTHNTTPKAGTSVDARGLDSQGGGWEVVLDANIKEQIPALIEEAEKKLFSDSRRKPVEVGRYEAVVDGGVTAALVSATIGRATQLDRAMGFEANAGGTSYLGPDPANFLGTKIGSDLLNIAADRSRDKGLATVKWDDEGVEPQPFNLIENGTLVDYQTTREQSAWLAEWYGSRGKTVSSNGCSVAPSALDFPLQHMPNISMAPGTEDVGFDDMVRSTPKGVAVLGGKVSVDFQSRSGAAVVYMREIVNGELGDVLQGAEILFDSIELWKSLMETGGQNSVVSISGGSEKGQPSQFSSATIAAVPVRLKDVSVSDRGRKG